MSPELYYHWSIIIAGSTSVFTLVGLIFACVQLWQIRKNRGDQFENARREKTVEMVFHYIKNTDNRTKAVEKIVSQFSDEQCQDLYNLVPFEVDDKTRQRLCGVCPYRADCKARGEHKPKYCQDGKKYYVRGDLLYSVRGSVINYLNSLECVLLAWQLGIVDQPSMEEQFAFLDKKGSKNRAVEAFRIAANGGTSYPAIEKFYQHLDQKRAEAAERSLKGILK